MFKKDYKTSSWFIMTLLALSTFWRYPSKAIYSIEVSTDRPFGIVRIWGGNAMFRGTSTRGESTGGDGTSLLHATTTSGLHVKFGEPHVRWNVRNLRERKQPTEDQLRYYAVLLEDVERNLVPPITIGVASEEPGCCTSMKDTLISWFMIESAMPEKYGFFKKWEHPGNMSEPPLHVKVTRKKGVNE